MTVRTDLASQALALIRVGQLPAAIALIESANDVERRDEALVRAHAIAVAQSGDASRASELLTPQLQSEHANLQTRALAARLYEDAARWLEAFAQYGIVVQALPQQLAFWRGLWRAALTCGADAAVARAVALTETLKPNFANDVGLSLAQFRGLRRLCASASDVERCLSLARSLCSRFAQDGAVRELVTQFVVDAIPLRAAYWLRDLPAISPSDSAQMLAIELAMPQLFTNDAAIDHWRLRYETGLQRFDALAANETSIAPAALRKTAFFLAYQGRSDLELQRLRGDTLARCVRPLTPPRITHADRRMRVGFVSKHIRDCTVGHYFRRFMTDLDDDGVAVYTYACGATDALTATIEARVSKALRFPLDNDEDNEDATLERIARSIAVDALDVLIYPEIGMEPLIEKLAAMRLAPLQCALWGHPDTTGLPTIDVYFSADTMEPANATLHYRERLHLLPGLGCAYPRPPAPAALSRAALGLPTDTPLFVCAQSSFKWRPRFVDAVAKLLGAHPDAKLVYFRNRDKIAALAFDDYLGERLRAAAIEASRIVALAETSREAFLAVLAACDVSLDTFDFSGGNTTLDALSVGLPIVTLPGEFMRGRQTMAMLQIAQADELIARDESDYLRIAGGLIANATTREKLRERLRISSTKCFDDERPVAAFRHYLLQARNANSASSRFAQ
jgi:Glycosyl transferase family 41